MSQHATPKHSLWQIYATGAAACAALTAGAYFLGVEPALARRAADAANRAELESRQMKGHDLERTLSLTRRQLEQTTRDVAELPMRLEPATAVNGRLARLADLAGETGLVLDEVQPGPAADAVHYQVVPIRIAGTGTYPSCAAFLHRLRERFPDMAIKSFDCTSSVTTGAPTAAGSRGPSASFHADLAWHTLPAGSRQPAVGSRQ